MANLLDAYKKDFAKAKTERADAGSVVVPLVAPDRPEIRLHEWTTGRSFFSVMETKEKRLFIGTILTRLWYLYSPFHQYQLGEWTLTMAHVVCKLSHQVNESLIPSSLDQCLHVLDS